MERNKIWGLIIAAALLVGLGAWLLGGDGEVEHEEIQADASEQEPVRLGLRRASARPELSTQPKAAIAGTVRDREGSPIAGAQICAWPQRADLEGHPPGTPRCTKSEADGHYRLDGLLPIRATVNAEARGFAPQVWFDQHETHREQQLRLLAGQTREGVDFVLTPGGVEIKGIVRDISGGVIEGAFVWARSSSFNDTGRSAGLSDAEGRFSLWSATGRINIVADADGYATNNRFTMAPGPTAELYLTPESVIVGRVVMAGTGEPVTGVVVDAEGEAFFSGDAGQARSDDAGEFRINKLSPGIYTLGARGDQLYGEATELIHLGLAATSKMVVIELHPAFVVDGQLRVAGGAEPRGCAQGFVRLADRDDKRNSRRGQVTTGGAIEIRSLLPGTYSVTASCDGMVSEPEYPDIVIADANVSGQVWEVREGLAIRGEIVDAGGAPVEGIRAFTMMKADPNDPRKQMTRGLSEASLADGSFVSPGLLPGTYDVWVFGSDRAGESEKVEVVLRPGADVNDVRLVLPGEGTLTGIVRDAESQPVAGVELSASAIGRRVKSVGVSDDQGRFIIEHVPPGEVRILAMDGRAPLRAPGTGDDDLQGTLAQVTAGETTEVEIVIESRTATISGRVLDEQGSPVADAFVSHQRMSDSAKAGKGAGKAKLRWRFDDQPVLTDIDGRFVIDGLAEDARYVIGAFRKGGGEAVEAEIKPGESIELTIIDTGEIAGKVTIGETDESPERFKLTVRNQAEGLSRNDELFRSGGAFRMKELPPGTYVLIIDSPAGSARVEGIELGAGEVRDDLRVTVSPRVTVRGRIIDLETREPVAGISVSVGARGTSMSFGSEKSGELPHVSNAEGRFTINDALTGKVMLAAIPRSFGTDLPYSWTWMPYQIPAGDEVVDLGDIEIVADRTQHNQKPGDIGFEVKAAALGSESEDHVTTVALIRPGGPADGSGLAVGDVIETVDGHDVKGAKSFRFARLTRVAPGASFALGTAGGKTIKITAGPAIK